MTNSILRRAFTGTETTLIGEVGEGEQTMEDDPQSTAVVFIDPQNDVLSPKG